MCGIISLLTNDNFVNIISNGLNELKNRGYDSMGICSIINKKILLHKFASNKNINALDKLKEYYPLYDYATIGLGHTRWATHGKNYDKNAHPHVSYDNKFAIVHNGIIENYLDIKNMLITNNITFNSDTDSEVIVNLLSFYYNNNNNNIEESIKQVIERLKGSWALCILCIDNPNTLYCTKKDNPLLVGIDDNYIIISSEQIGFSKYTNKYIILENNDICIIEKKDNLFKLKTNNIYNYKLIDENNNSCENYTHWTLKEIYDQKNSIRNLLNFNNRIINNNNVQLLELDKFKSQLLNIDNLILLGCGTSYYAGLIGVNYFKDLCNFNTVQLYDGADFNFTDVPLYGKTGLILLSQSGETKDLHRCIEIAKHNNLFTIGVINVVNSLIAREVDCVCYLNAGREVGVASTKSFTSQCTLLSLISLWFSYNRNINNELMNSYIYEINKLQSNIEYLFTYIEEQIKKYLYIFKHKKSCFVLGKGKSYAIAKEGALKIKEISYIHSEGYSSSSLKHGPFALLNREFPVLMISLNDDYYIKNENVYNEIISREATVLFITDNKDALYTKENVIIIPENKHYGEILSVIVLQFLAYYLSIENNINPDFPKNLAKVVTVE